MVWIIRGLIMQKGSALIIILISILMIILMGGSVYYFSQKTPQSPQTYRATYQPTPTTSSQQDNTVLPPKDIAERICGSEVIYKTQLQVQDNDSAQKAFQAYVDYMKANKLKDNNLAIDWFFTKVEDAGYYKNIRYWVVTFSYLMVDGGEKGNAQTYVNQDGEITNLLGCI